jgi:RimJ/RimL family protein N-acetyltransferase
VQETARFVQECEREWDTGEKFYFVAATVADGAPVGFASVRIEDDCRATLGFVVFRNCRGQGYAPEIIRILGDWALSQPGIFRIHGLCDVENTASARAMEKAGFQREGVLRRWGIHPNVAAEPRDVLCYSRVR